MYKSSSYKYYIKSASDYIYEAMAAVYNLSIEQGVVPSILKTSEVLPVDKGGDITDPSIVTTALFQYFPCLPRKQAMLKNMTSYINTSLVLRRADQLSKLLQKLQTI